VYADRFPTLQVSLKDTYAYVAYRNGEFVDAESAGLSIWDHGLLYGDAVFEGIRVYGGHVFREHEHLNRLWRSAHALQMTIPLAEGEIAEVIAETLARNELSEAHVKVLVTRGIAPMGMDPRLPLVSSVVVYAYPYPPLLGTAAVRLVTAANRRKSPQAVDSKIKSTNYLDNVLAKLQAIAAGADDALMLDVQSFVAEATSANVFVVAGDHLRTPFCHAALEGITRNIVMGCARSAGMAVTEENLTLYDVYTADEVFLSGTAAEIVSVSSLDGRSIGAAAPGPVTARLADAYRRVIEVERRLAPGGGDTDG
jgi:branched-chain amino acid aminotransferase